jgi:hypothetical protein
MEENPKSFIGLYLRPLRRTAHTGFSRFRYAMVCKTEGFDFGNQLFLKSSSLGHFILTSKPKNKRRLSLSRPACDEPLDDQKLLESHAEVGLTSTTRYLPDFPIHYFYSKHPKTIYFRRACCTTPASPRASVYFASDERKCIRWHGKSVLARLFE